MDTPKRVIDTPGKLLISRRSDGNMIVLIETETSGKFLELVVSPAQFAYALTGLWVPCTVGINMERVARIASGPDPAQRVNRSETAGDSTD